MSTCLDRDECDSCGSSDSNCGHYGACCAATGKCELEGECPSLECSDDGSCTVAGTECCNGLCSFSNEECTGCDYTAESGASGCPSAENCCIDYSSGGATTFCSPSACEGCSSDTDCGDFGSCCPETGKCGEPCRDTDPESCRGDYSNIEISFVFDTTGSMSSYLGQAIAMVDAIVARTTELSAEKDITARLGFVAYRDHPPEESTYVTKFLDLTTAD